MVIRITRDAFSMVPATQMCQILISEVSTGAMQERMVRCLWTMFVDHNRKHQIFKLRCLTFYKKKYYLILNLATQLKKVRDTKRLENKWSQKATAKGSFCN